MEFTEQDKEVLLEAIDNWSEEGSPLDPHVLRQVVEVFGRIERGCSGVKNAMRYLFQLNPIQIGLFQEPPTKYRGLQGNYPQKESYIEVIISKRKAFITKERLKQALSALKIVSMEKNNSEPEKIS